MYYKVDWKGEHKKNSKEIQFKNDFVRFCILTLDEFGHNISLIEAVGKWNFKLGPPVI